MDIKSLQTVVSVADHGGFAAAAGALGLSVSGVSVHIKLVEEEFGLALFDRSRRPMRLTEDGKAFVERARDLILDWERLGGEFKPGATRGALKVGSVHTAVSGILPVALLKMQETAPGIQLRLTTALTHILEAGVRDGTLDAAIVTRPDPLPADLSFSPFCEEEMAVIARGVQPDISYRELLQQNAYVRFNRNGRVGALIESGLFSEGIQVKSFMEIDTLEGVLSLVQSGLGVSIIPVRNAGVGMPDGLTILPFGNPPLKRELGLLTPERNARRNLTDPLLQALYESSQ